MWLDDDQDEILAHLRERTRVCSGCGTHPDEWAADRDAYIPDVGRCPGCQRLEQARAGIPDGIEGRGAYAFLEPRAAALARAEADGAVT